MSHPRATAGERTRGSSLLWGLVVLGVAIPMATWQTPSPAGPDQSVGVAVARFYRGDRTLVNGFVRVPHRMLEGVRLGPGGFAAYTAMLTVTDSSGAVLTREQWTRRVDWRSVQVAGAATVEPLTLALAPGVYRVQVVVRDSATGRQETAQVQVVANAGSIDLGGLPPGSYRLVLVAGGGADTVARTAPFQMAGFEAEREVAAAQQATEPESTDRFASAQEAELDSLFGPLIYLGTPG